MDPVSSEEEATTPLFRRASGDAIRVSEVRQMVKAMMGMLGWNPDMFGAHSLMARARREAD